MKDTFAKNLKKYREKKNLTQRQLAEMAGITASSISSYENEAMSPSLEIVEKLACALNINIVDLICENQLENIVPTTYADVIQLLYSISKSTPINFSLSYDMEGVTVGSSFGFTDSVLNEFLISWEKMYRLVQEQTIEESLLDYWIRQQMEANSEEVPELPC